MCEEKYIRESARTSGERLRNISVGYLTKLNNFSIVGRGSHIITRTIKEAMYIRINDPSLNRNIVKYQLPHIWDEVLCNIPGLHLT